MGQDKKLIKLYKGVFRKDFKEKIEALKICSSMRNEIEEIEKCLKITIVAYRVEDLKKILIELKIFREKYECTAGTNFLMWKEGEKNNEK